jgi:adenosine deaminase
MAPVHQNEKPREKVSESALEKGRPGQPVPSPSPVPAADNCSQLNEIPAGNQHGEVPGHRGEDPDGTAAVPNESEAEELLAGASSPRVPEEKEDCEEPLGGEEPPGQEGGRIGDEEEEGHDRQRGEEKRAPGKDEKVHPVSGGSDPEACRREDTGRKIAVGCRIVPPAPAGRRFLARFRSAPKIELHLHLEGSIAPATLVRLSARSPRPIFPDIPAVRARRTGAGGLRGFLELYRDVCRCLSRPEDYADLARDLVRHLRRERIRHAEVYVSPAVVERIGLPWPPVREALERVFSHHERSGCGSVLVLLDSVRQWGPGAAHRVLDLEERSPWRRAAGFGLGGDEGSVPARDFAGVYARVRRLGLAPTVHAGEWGGPDSVAEALRWLRPVRIAHGIRAAEDRALMRLLARRGVACDVCPTSNVVTGALPSIAEVARRVSALLGAGVTVTLSTDDPGLFGTTLLREFRTLASEGLPEATLAALARGSRAAALSATGPSRRR